MSLKITSVRSIVIAVAVTAAVGCHHDDKPKLSVNDQFRPDDEPRAMQNIFARQIANGARDDAQLYPAHFTDGELNSLGLAKLDAICRGTTSAKTTVYVDVPKADADAAEQAVATYFTNRGFSEERFAVETGANMTEGTPAAVGLRGLSKQAASESSSDGGDEAKTAVTLPN